MTTTVAYHRDGYGPARPAINVKLHVAGHDLWPRAFDALPLSSDGAQEVGRTTAADLVDAAYNITQSDFWQAADELAAQYGLGAITQEGRSGGWLVFDDGRDPDSMLDDPNYEGEDYAADQRDWLGAYGRYAAWVNAELAAAPTRIARLAQDIAMDELGAAAVNKVVLP